MSTKFWFATPLYEGRASGDDLGLISAEVADALANALETFQHIGREPGVITTLRPETPGNFIAENGLRVLAQTILRHAAAFCTDLGASRFNGARIESSWASIFSTDGFLFARNYSPSMMSGLYFHQVASKGGKVIFNSPNVFFNSYDFPNNDRECASTVEYTPRIGDILLFPSWLSHFFDVVQSNDETIVVNFNLHLKK